MRSCLALGVLACLLLASAHGQDAVKDELARLAGTWQAVAIEDGTDQKPPEGELEKIKITITGTNIAFDAGGEKRMSTFKIDPSKSPKQMDMTTQNGARKAKVYKGYYALDGDMLKLCFSDKLEDRPKEMKGDAKTVTSILVLKRVKK